MGRHYPDIPADPVKQPGYYYSRKAHKLARLDVGDKLPRHMGPWEYIAREDEGTSSEILQRLRQMYPSIDPYRLSFATSTPIDIGYMARRRMARIGGWVVAAAAALAFGLLVGRRLSAPRA